MQTQSHLPTPSLAATSPRGAHLDQLITLVTGALILCLGLIVLIGWYTHGMPVVRLVPYVMPMQPNTAWGFVLSGLGLLAVAWERSRLALGCGIGTMVLPLLILIEYVFKINLGLDQLIAQPFLLTNAVYPGRLGPHSALCFALSGAVLVILRKPAQHALALAMPGMLGAMVTALGLSASLGYLLGVPMAYHWEQSTDMAIHSAVGFTLLGTGILAATWKQHSAAAVSSLLIPILVGLGIGSTTLYIWRSLITYEHRALTQTVSLALAQVQAEVGQEMSTHLLPLVRLARRWDGRGQPSREEWDAEATVLLQSDTSIKALAWADTVWQVRLLAPRQDSPQTQHLGTTTRQLQTLELMLQRSDITVTPILELARGGKGMHAYVPIFQDGNISGVIVGVLQVQAWLDRFLRNVAPDFAMMVFDGDEVIYRRGGITAQVEESRRQESIILLPGHTWRVRLWPAPELLASTSNNLSNIVLILGFLAAISLASLIALAQTNRQRALQLCSYVQQMDAVRSVNTKMTIELDLATLLDLMIRQAVALVPAAQSGTVYLWDKIDHALIAQAWHNREEGMQGVRFKLGEGLVGTVAQRRVGLMVCDYQHSPYAHPTFVATLGNASAIAEPLLYREQLVGVLTVNNCGSTLPFTAADQTLLTHFATQASIAIANAQLFAEVQARTAALVQTNLMLEDEIADRQQAEAALQTSYQFLQAILDALPSSMAILDHTGTVVAVNAAWRRFADANNFTGTAHGLGMNYLEICAATTGDEAVQAQRVAAGIRDTLRRRRDEFFCEYTCHSPTEQHWFMVRVARFESPQGTRAVVMHEDVSELKQAESQLQRQQEALYQREKLAAMGSLLASVAHELNNPLSVVMMQTELLREDAQDQDIAEQAAIIHQSAERCMYMVRNFLTLARQSPPRRTHVHLHDLVEDVMSLLRHPLQLDNVNIQQHLADNLPTLWADPHQLHQVMVNLITNAHQALREVDGPQRQLTLTTRTDQAGSMVVLEIGDTGPGIPTALQGRIFEPFFTTKPLGMGTGLGLPFCQGIIESHGGTITVESQPGHGTMFRVRLPVEVVPTSITVPREPETVAACTIQRQSILVVDDEPGITKTLAYFLRRDGHTVDTAADGRQALAKLQGHTYDLILCDLRMPTLDGPALYRELESSASTMLKRFIFLTGDTLSPDIGRFLAQVSAPRLIKPFKAAEVRRVVQHALRDLHAEQRC